MLITFEKILFLKTVPLFENVSETVLCDIVEQSTEVSALKSSFIVKEKEKFDSMYIVLQGSVSVTRRDKLLAKLKKGGVFGEVYVFDPCPSEFTIIANEDSSLLQIDSDTMYSLVNDYPDVAKTFLPQICRRLRALEEVCL